MLATFLGSKLPWIVIVGDMISPSLTKGPVVEVHIIQAGPSWMDPIITFLKCMKCCLRIKLKWKRYVEVLPAIGYLGSRSCTNALIQVHIYCVHLEVVEPLLKELHESICGSHTGGRSLAHKALT